MFSIMVAAHGTNYCWRSAALKAITLSTCKPAYKANHVGNEKSACDAKPFWLGLICVTTLSSTQLQCAYLNVHTKINM